MQFHDSEMSLLFTIKLKKNYKKIIFLEATIQVWIVHLNFDKNKIIIPKATQI
jgi:hypothetical protein